MKELLYKKSEAVAALNRVDGFHPMELARKIGEEGQEEQLYLDTVIYPFIRMIKKKCKAVDAEKLNLMLWKIYMVSSRKEEFVTAAKKELQPYLTKKDEKQIDTTYDTTYTIDRRH